MYVIISVYIVNMYVYVYIAFLFCARHKSKDFFPDVCVYVYICVYMCILYYICVCILYMYVHLYIELYVYILYSEFGVDQRASVTHNEFRDNRPLHAAADGGSAAAASYSMNREEAAVSGYTLALRGVQKVIVVHVYGS